MCRGLLVVVTGCAITASAIRAEAHLDLYVDKSTQRIAVVQNGYTRYVWPVSTGRDGYATPNGIYAPERLERTWYSKEYYDSPMPYSIFFHSGYAIHGSYDISRLGGPASHGCIRLHPEDAAILFELVQKEGPADTTIVIGGDAQSDPRGARYRDMENVMRPPAPGGYAQGAPMYEAMPPRPMPHRDIDRRGDLPGRPGDDNRKFVMRDFYRAARPQADPTERNAPAGTVPIYASQPKPAGAIEPAKPRPGDVGDSAKPKPATPGAPGQPKSVEPNQAGKGQASVTKETASGRVESIPSGKPLPEPAQTSTGYTILPKSYWSGAGWRWRSKLEQKPQ
jgi:hypothetical protein